MRELHNHRSLAPIFTASHYPALEIAPERFQLLPDMEGESSDRAKAVKAFKVVIITATSRIASARSSTSPSCISSLACSEPVQAFS